MKTRRPRKDISAAFFDYFSDLPLSEQRSAIRIMQEIIRQKERDAAKTTAQEPPKA
jgi:hypothetical protein